MDFFMTVVAERSRHFIHRTKEEMVRFDGRPLYPQRHCDTLSYALRPAEQELYDATTRYIAETYNKARILNRSAARLAMSVFQRRLASSTYALMRSCVPAGPTSWSGIRRASPTRPISSSPEPPTKTPATEANGKVMKRSRRPPRAASPRSPWRSCGKSVPRSRPFSPGHAVSRSQARTPSSRSCARSWPIPPLPGRSSSSSPSIATRRSSWCAAWKGSASSGKLP